MSTRSGSASALALGVAAIVSVAFLARPHAGNNERSRRGAANETSMEEMVARGRYLVISHDCAGCHGGTDPAGEGWLTGRSGQGEEFLIGPCAYQPGATPCFHTRPRNLTPDNMTGMGRFTERQIFNAMRYGLRPEDTPDVEITASTPGSGNFPIHPHYLAPPMPWPAWRHMPDEELMAIAAYLKHGLKPVSHKVPDSEGPPDFWASEYTVEKIGHYPAPPFPTANEVAPLQAKNK